MTKHGIILTLQLMEQSLHKKYNKYYKCLNFALHSVINKDVGSWLFVFANSLINIFVHDK